MTDANQTQLLFMIGAAGVFIGGIIKEWRDDNRAKKQAAEVEKVRKTLETTTTDATARMERIEATGGEAKATGEKIHTLVNSAMGAVLLSNAELARWKADHEPTQENIKAAEMAENTLRQHEGKQAAVDAGVKTSGSKPLTEAWGNRPIPMNPEKET